MKKIKVKAFDCAFFIYNSDEAEKFEKAYKLNVGDDYGKSCGNGIWIGECDDRIGVCYHEAVHAVDWLLEDRLSMKQRKLFDNTDLRAYLVEYIGNEVRRYCCGQG